MNTWWRQRTEYDDERSLSPVCSVCRCPCRAASGQDNHRCRCPRRTCSRYLPSPRYTAAQTKQQLHLVNVSLAGKLQCDDVDWQLCTNRTGNLSIPLHGAVSVRVTGVKGQRSTRLPGEATWRLVTKETRFTASTLEWALRETREKTWR